MTKLGRSMISLRIEKQNVHGTGAPLGFSSTQCEYTDCVVFSNAWFAKFSQYSTTDCISGPGSSSSPESWGLVTATYSASGIVVPHSVR